MTERASPIAIEVKVGGNTLSEEQDKVRKQMLENGWNYRVVNSLEMMLSILNVPNHIQ